VPQLIWTREEIILAMDLYVSVGGLTGGSVPGSTSRTVTELSAQLKQLGAYPPEVQDEDYRNTNGVYLKLMNLRSVQTEGAHGMDRRGQRDAAVWREFADDLPRLHAEAATIRARLQEGAIGGAGTVPTSEDVDIEQQHTETFMTNPSAGSRPAERAEQRLVLSYRDYMASKGVRVRRKRYLPAGEVRPIYSDAWVEDRNALIEAKNSDARDVFGRLGLAA
jgi:hypothetical protein